MMFKTFNAAKERGQRALARTMRDLTSIEKRYEEVRYELAREREKLKEAKLEYEKALKDLSQRHEALRRIEDFLDGKITHFAVLSGYLPTVRTAKEALEETDPHYRHEMKLLSLFGDTKGNLSWRMNLYRDGSGCWYEVVPCASFEEARDRVMGFLRSRESRDGGLLERVVNSGLKLDEDLAAELRAMQREERRQKLHRAKELFEKTKAEIAELSMGN